MDSPLSDMGDFGDSEFYGARGDFGGSDDRTQLPTGGDMVCNKEVIGTFRVDTEECEDAQQKYESSNGELEKLRI